MTRFAYQCSNSSLLSISGLLSMERPSIFLFSFTLPHLCFRDTFLEDDDCVSASSLIDDLRTKHILTWEIAFNKNFTYTGILVSILTRRCFITSYTAIIKHYGATLNVLGEQFNSAAILLV